MSKKEKNAWDRFWLYVKENEKVIWVLLLLLLAPTFAFTGAFQSYMTAGRNPKFAVVFGKTIDLRDFNVARKGIAVVQEVRSAAWRFEPYRMMMRPQISTENWGVLDFLAQKEEATRLGLRVTKYELGAAIRELYRHLVAQEKAMEAAMAVKAENQKDASRQQSIAQSAYYATVEDLEKKDEFGPAESADWFDRLKNWRSPTWQSGAAIPRGEFEESLRDVLLIEKLEEYVKGSIQVTQDEAFARFQKDEQSRKFSFFSVGSEAEKAEVEKGISDADIAARYEKGKEDFSQPLGLRVSYLSIPVAAFEKDVTLTDEDLRKEYDRVKSQKYQTFVGETPGGFNLETPEERAARESKAFRPFDEVKEEVRGDLLKSRTREAARSAAEKIREKLFPQKPGSVGEKKEEKPAPVPATYAEIQKEFPAAKTATTPWVDRASAEKEMGEAWTSTVSSWFNLLEGDKNRPAKKEVDPPKSYTTAPSFSDPQTFIFYQKPEVRPAGIRELAEVKDKVRETLVKEKLFEKAKEKAKALSDAVREGKKTLEDAAKEAGSTVIVTGFIERNDSVKVPMTPEEIEKAAAERKTAGAADEETPKEKDFTGSRSIVEYGFQTVQEKGKVEGFAEDPENGACYVVRWDDAIYPDATRFATERTRVEARLLAEKQRAYVTEWKKKLGERSGAGFYRHRDEEGAESEPVE